MPPPQAGIVRRDLLAVPVYHGHGHAIVGHENNQGVFQGLPLTELLHQQSDIGIDVLDHAVTAGGLAVVTLLEKALFGTLGRDHRAVRCIERDEGKPGVSGLLLPADPRQRRAKKEVSAEPLGPDHRVILEQHIVEVGILGIGSEVAEAILTDPPRTVHEDFVEAAFLRQVLLVVVTEMPLPEQAGRIAGLLQRLRKRHHLRCQALALENRVTDPDLEGRAPAHEGRAGRRAGRTDLEVGEAGALGIEAVEVRRLQDGIPHAREIPHPLVICHDQDDVRSAAGEFELGRSRRQAEQEDPRDQEKNAATYHHSLLRTGESTVTFIQT